MDEQPEREPSGSADAEARRRSVVLAELHRRRTKRRWIVGLSTALVSALIISGSVVAWSSQARAGTIAEQIEAWHEEHELAGCELTVRIVSAVGLERRAEDVLGAAEHIGGAEWLLPRDDRTVFAQQRDALLQSIAEGAFTTAEDRALAELWEERAAKAADPASFDLLGECVAAAAAEREPIDGVTAERADALDRELRALGDPRDFDDSRIDRLEAALQQLRASAIATAEGRTGFTALQSTLSLAPESALASLRSADEHVSALLQVLRGEHSLTDVLGLVEGMSLHIAAAWMAEAFQLEAQGDAEGAAALAAASQQTRDAVAGAAPPPATDPGTATPPPVIPPREESPVPPPAPTQPPPVETVGPLPPLPQPDPGPVPEPEPEPEPEPGPIDPDPEPEPLPPEPPQDPGAGLVPPTQPAE